MTSVGENEWTSLGSDPMAFVCKQKLRLKFELTFGTFNFTQLFVCVCEDVVCFFSPKGM